MTTETEREALRAEWRRLSGSTMRPIATHVGRCPSCKRIYGVKEGVLNDHGGDQPFACPGGTPEEVTPL